jgi:nucleoside-diphosphate kinase
VSERTLVLVKPDGVRRGLVGEVLGRLERKGLRLVACELRQVDRETAAEHYAEHAGKPFLPAVLDFITSGPLVALVVEGERAIVATRTLMGATDPIAAAPGTLRGDFCTVTSQNLVHGSDSPESAAREIALFFPALA